MRKLRLLVFVANAAVWVFAGTTTGQDLVTNRELRIDGKSRYGFFSPPTEEAADTFTPTLTNPDFTLPYTFAVNEAILNNIAEVDNGLTDPADRQYAFSKAACFSEGDGLNTTWFRTRSNCPKEAVPGGDVYSQGQLFSEFEFQANEDCEMNITFVLETNNQLWTSLTGAVGYVRIREQGNPAPIWGLGGATVGTFNQTIELEAGKVYILEVELSSQVFSEEMAITKPLDYETITTVCLDWTFEELGGGIQPDVYDDYAVPKATSIR